MLIVFFGNVGCLHVGSLQEVFMKVSISGFQLLPMKPTLAPTASLLDSGGMACSVVLSTVPSIPSSGSPSVALCVSSKQTALLIVCDHLSHS